MARDLVEKTNGKVVDRATGAEFSGKAVRDMEPGDLLERPDKKRERIVEKYTSPEGFLIVRTVEEVIGP